MITKVKFFTLLVLFAIVSCKGKSVSVEELTNKKWILQECKIGWEKISVSQDAPVLIFNDSTSVSGSTGCNRIIGHYNLIGDSISINIMGITRMGCPEEIMDFETKYVDAFKSTMSVSLLKNGTEVVLKNQSEGIEFKYELFKENDIAACGSDSDEHGCKGSAGYQWSALRNDCIRIFEDGIRLNPVVVNSGQAVISSFIVFAADSSKIEIFLPNTGSGIIAEADGKSQWIADNGYSVSDDNGVWNIKKGDELLFSSAEQYR